MTDSHSGRLGIRRLTTIESQCNNCWELLLPQVDEDLGDLPVGDLRCFCLSLPTVPISPSLTPCSLKFWPSTKSMIMKAIPNESRRKKSGHGPWVRGSWCSEQRVWSLYILTFQIFTGIQNHACPTYFIVATSTSNFSSTQATGVRPGIGIRTTHRSLGGRLSEFSNSTKKHTLNPPCLKGLKNLHGTF